MQFRSGWHCTDGIHKRSEMETFKSGRIKLNNSASSIFHSVQFMLTNDLPRRLTYRSVEPLGIYCRENNYI